MKQAGPIKLVLSDVDGTLVRGGPYSLISQKVQQTLTKLKRNSIKVCLATGRSLGEMKPVLKSYPFDGLIILFGGAVIYDFKQQKAIWEKNIDKDCFAKVLRIGKQYHCSIKTFDLEKMHFVTTTFRFKENHFKTIVLEKKTLESIDKILEELKKIPNIHAAYVGKWVDNHGIQVTNSQATKQYAAFEVLKLTAIKREDTLGIGDKPNDLPLLSACQIKIAMGNADPALKEIADFVTKTVDDDGFAYAMEKFVLRG